MEQDTVPWNRISVKLRGDDFYVGAWLILGIFKCPQLRNDAIIRVGPENSRLHLKRVQSSLIERLSRKGVLEIKCDIALVFGA